MDLRRPTRPPPSGRRNLFHTSSSRRPNQAMSSTSSLSTIRIPAEEPDPKGDLVERDSNGCYKIAAPSLHLGPPVGLKSEYDEEMVHENQLIELYGKQNGHWDQGALLADIKSALESSLEKKVQSLEHDRWMFEGDSKSKG